MYVWCSVHDYTSGVVCMWCCVHVVQVVLFAGGAVYTRCCIHGVYVVMCTCGIVCTLYRWCSVHVALCTCCVGGALYRWYYVCFVHIVLVHRWYYVHVVHVVLYIGCMRMHFFCRILCVDVCLVLYIVYVYVMCIDLNVYFNC